MERKMWSQRVLLKAAENPPWLARILVLAYVVLIVSTVLDVVERLVR